MSFVSFLAGIGGVLCSTDGDDSPVCGEAHLRHKVNEVSLLLEKLGFSIE